MKCALRSFLCILILLELTPRSICAQEVPFTLDGHLKYQGTLTDHATDSVFSELGPDTTFTHDLEWRINTELDYKSWDFKVHTELLATGGGGTDTKESVASFGPLNTRRELLINDDRRLFNGTIKLLDEKNSRAVLRLDRLSARYSSERLVIRLGRQALSWGNSLVFSVLDIFNPFSPIEIDKDYKTADDMLFAEWLAARGSNLQAVAVGRRSVDESIRAKESSLALKFHQRLEPILVDLDLIIARHYDENFYGLSFSRDLLDGVLRADISVSETKENSTPLNFTLNYDRSWVVSGHNLYAYIEYFRSGLGISDGNYQTLEEQLSKRIERGELFLLGRDYLAAGSLLELTPLLQWHSPVIFNLHDESGIIQQRFEYDRWQNTTLTWGLNVPFGPKASEFGGILLPDGQLVFAPGLSFYLRASYFY